MRRALATLFLAAIVSSCGGPVTTTGPGSSGAMLFDEAAAIQVATHVFQTAQPIGATISNLTAKASLEPGAANGANAGRTVWVVQVDGDISQPPGATYTSHFLIEVDPATGAATVVGQG
jgi:hypothetical protein